MSHQPLTPTTTAAAVEPKPTYPGFMQLVNDFSEGGLTPAQYASFALAGIFVVLLALTTVISIHATRRANAIEAESSMAAIGRWKDAERDIVKSVPEPPRLQVGAGVGRQLQKPVAPGLQGAKGVLAHMRRYSAEGRRARSQSQSQGRGRSIDIGRTGPGAGR